MQGEIRIPHSGNFRQHDVDLAAGESNKPPFLFPAPGPGRNDGKPRRAGADRKLAVPLIDELPDPCKAVPPSLVFVARRAVKQGLVDGVEIPAKLEAPRKRLPEPDADIHDRDLNNVFPQA